MGIDWFADVMEFHRKFRPDLIGTTPAEPTTDVAEMRMRLIDEEIAELRDAMYRGDMPGIADGIGDAVYVLAGKAITYGIDLRPVWDEIHRANMAKDAGGTRADGKVLKPPGWQPPDVAGVLARQGPLRPESFETRVEWCDRLFFDPTVSESSPCVKGTWVTAAHVVSLVMDGWTWEDILRTHPELSEDDIRECLAYTVDADGKDATNAGAA